MTDPSAHAADVSFTPSPGRTRWVELELGLLDHVTLDLVSRADEILASPAPLSTTPSGAKKPARPPTPGDCPELRPTRGGVGHL
jgi:hypothetical protein